MYDKFLTITEGKIKKYIFIVNDQPQTMPGQHWLLIFVNPEIVYLIDSYGMPPDFYQLREKLHTFRRRFFVNKVDIRTLESKTRVHLR